MALALRSLALARSSVAALWPARVPLKGPVGHCPGVGSIAGETKCRKNDIEDSADPLLVPWTEKVSGVVVFLALSVLMVQLPLLVLVQILFLLVAASRLRLGSARCLLEFAGEAPLRSQFLERKS